MAASVNIYTLHTGQNMPESTQLYRQVENGHSDCIFALLIQSVMAKNIPSEALLLVTVLVTVLVFSIRDKTRHTVRHTVIPEATPAIDTERLRDIYFSKSSAYVASQRNFGYARMGKNHSHSIAPKPRKELFLFIKFLTPLRFSRQPYRQKFGLLISLRNFELSKIHPTAVYRQQSQPRLFVSPRPK